MDIKTILKNINQEIFTILINTIQYDVKEEILMDVINEFSDKSKSTEIESMADLFRRLQVWLDKYADKNLTEYDHLVLNQKSKLFNHFYVKTRAY